MIQDDRRLQKELRTGKINPSMMHVAWEAVDQFIPRHKMTSDDLAEALLWNGTDYRQHFLDILEVECALRLLNKELAELIKHT